MASDDSSPAIVGGGRHLAAETGIGFTNFIFLSACGHFLKHCPHAEIWTMGSRSSLWRLAKSSTVGAVLGLTISDRYVSVTSIRGESMQPTFTGIRSLMGDLVLLERFCLQKYKFSRGDVIVFKCPNDHKLLYIKRLIALPGEGIRHSQSSDMVTIPKGHCWVEGDNSECSLDSRSFGPIPMGLITGRVTHVVWPPQRIGKVERKILTGRVSAL